VREFIQTNKQFIIIVAIWAAIGIYARPASLFVIPLFFLILWKKELHQEILLGLYCILIFSDSFYMPFAKDVKPIIVLIVGFLFLINTNIFHPTALIYKAFIPFFILIVILLSIAPRVSISAEKVLSYILLYMAIPSYILSAYRKNGKTFLKSLIFVGVSILLIGFLYRIIMPEITISHGDRYRGIFGNPNGVAMFAYFIFILYYLIQSYYPDLFKKNEKIIIYIAIILTLFLAKSRNCIACVLIFLIFTRTHKLSPTLSIVLFLILVISYQIITDNLLTIIGNLGLESYFRTDTLKEGSGRLVAWQFAWIQIQDAFYFGHGFDYNQYIFFIPKNQKMLNDLNHQGDVHNVYLGIWLDTGLVGLLLFFSAFIYTFYWAGNYTPLAFPTLLSMLFMSNYEPWLIASLNPYTISFLMFATIAIYCKGNSDTNTVEAEIAYTPKKLPA
jgi:O-antigen ligase